MSENDLRLDCLKLAQALFACQRNDNGDLVPADADDVLSVAQLYADFVFFDEEDE